MKAATEARPPGGKPRATAYRRGYYYERRTAARLATDGYYVIQSRGSHGAADLVAVKRGQVLLVQVKSGKAQLTSGEWNKLYDISRRVGAVPLVADWPGRGTLRLRRITAPHAPRAHAWPSVPFVTDEAAETAERGEDRR